jgi:cytochrome c oxidase subunit 2
MEFFRSLVALPIGASTFAQGIDTLHLVVITTTMLASFYVFFAASWFAIRWYRGDRAKLDTTPVVRASALRETATISIILIVFVVWWVIGFVQFVHMSDPPKDATTIVVQAKQWMWKFTYPDGRETNDVLTVPVNRPIRLLMTSRDVIHSFYVPQFRVKHDVLPGQYVTTWFQSDRVGEYDIFCAEYCGANHSRMLGHVVVLSDADYEKWLRRGSEAPQGEDLAQRGVAVATRRGCVSCHTLDGQPHVGPTWARLYGRVVTLSDGRKTVADDAYLTRSMMDPNTDIVEGYHPVMPTYAGALTPAEVGALVELIRSLQTAPVAPSVPLPRIEITPVDAGPNEPWPSNVGEVAPPPVPPPSPVVGPATPAMPRPYPYPFPAVPVPAEPAPLDAALPIEPRRPLPNVPAPDIVSPPRPVEPFPTRPPAPAAPERDEP